MIMKLGRSPTDLDLDPFLNSSSSTALDFTDDDEEENDDDDGGLSTIPHRTVDDILNDSDSSSSSSSAPLLDHSHLPHPQTSSDHSISVSQPDSHRLNGQIPSGDAHHSVGVPQLRPDETLKFASEDDVYTVQSRTRSFRRASSGESSVDLFSLGRRFSRPLPPLFGSIRSNANKPGAALAAAAAASRSVPTPHAAAIKSRRAGSGAMHKLLNNYEMSSVASDDSEVVLDSGASVEEGLGPPSGASNCINSNITHANDDKTIEEDKTGEAYHQVGITRVESVDCTGKLLLGRDIVDFTAEGSEFVSEKETTGAGTDELDANDLRINDANRVLCTSDVGSEMGSSVELEKDMNRDREHAASGAMDLEDQRAESPSPCENAIVADGNSSTFEAISSIDQGIASLPSPAKDQKLEGDSAALTSGIEDSGKVMLYSSDGEVGLAGDKNNPGSDVSEIVDNLLLQWEAKRDIRRVGKKLHIPANPLELAEELEKKQASTGLHWEEGAAAQPMRLEGVRRGSTVLGYFDSDADNTITRTISSQRFRRDHGSPQVVAVHPIFLAVGMSKGLIIVISSRYSVQSADNMDPKMLMLGLQGDRSHASVTSICFNQQGDLLLAGYGDGHITVWDVQRTAAAKVITGEHAAPVVHTFFLGQDSRQFIAVTGDSKGLVLLHEFSSSMVPLLNRFSIKTKCILDGQRGKVLSASPLLFDEFYGGALMSSHGSNNMSSSSLGSMVGGVVGGDAGWKLFSEGSSLVEEGVVIFVTNQTALVIRLTPTPPEVYAQLSKPDGVREGSMPYSAWKCMVQAHDSSTEKAPAEAFEKVSLLAIAWDRKVLVAKMVKSELKICGKWTLESVAIGVAWLDDQMLVILTLAGQLCLFAKDGTLIHKTSFSIDGSGGDDLIVYHTNFINIFGNPEKSYHNSVAVRGASIYILGPSHLIVSRLLPWKERIQVLRKAGDWMGALNMAMTIYDGEAHGVIDLPRTLEAVQEAIMPDLVELLFSYVDEVFSYISVAFHNQLGKMEQQAESKNTTGFVHSEIKEQFTRVGGVAVEFCVHIKKTDILFDEIYSKFVAVQHRDTFLELLEPYILKDMLGFLPPEIMQALVEHYSSKGWLQRVEQCVLHMDISSLDFNQVVKLCREHGLYGALVYLFNRGLDDFRAPLEELLTVVRNSQSESAAPLGYRMLVYLKYCFSGLAFPPGHGTIPPARLPSLRHELLQFLLEESTTQCTKSRTSLSSSEGGTNLCYLLELDTEATLDVLRCAFDGDKSSNPEFSLHDSMETVDADEEKILIYKTNNMLVQKTVDVLVHILDKAALPNGMSFASDKIASVETWPSKKDIGHIFDFIAYYVACEKAFVSKNTLGQILEYLTSVTNFTPGVDGRSTEISKKREKQLLALLDVVPGTDWNESYVLHLCEKAQFYQVCGLIYTFRGQYLAALDSYIRDIDEPVHAFSFIHNTLLQHTGSKSDAFQSAVISRISELVNLSREGTFFMIIDQFNKESQDILAELRLHPKSLFLYLKTMIEVHLSGTLNFSSLKKGDDMDVSGGRRLRDHLNGFRAYLERIADFPKILRNNPVCVNDEITELYLELLCQYERDSVLKFLQTFESYRVEHCLRLCQEFRIIDAAAFLLERVGDVGSALLLTLSGLNDKFITLDTALGSVPPDAALSSFHGIEHFSTILRIKEVNEIHDVLRSCIGLCQRNSPRLDPEESKFLWFQLLDSFCKPLMDSCNSRIILDEENYTGMLAQLNLGTQKDNEFGTIKWRISKSHRSAIVLKRLFSQFIKEIVEGMMGHVHLPTVMSKLLSDNSFQEFGDFKLTIMGMLGTYGFEKRILDTAKSLIEDDAFYTMSLLKKGASHGYSPQILVCCICNCPLSKNASSSRIRVYGCGHSTHLQCELQENESSSRGSSAGCPVCMPKKKTQRSKSKSIFAEGVLPSKSSSRSQKAQGTHVLLSYESDAQENPYGHQQISRFDVLTNLQKEHHSVRVENVPHLRLAPPAVYHEKVKKGTDFLSRESTSGAETSEKLNQNRQLREPKLKRSSLQFPLKSSIFGKEKSRKR